MTVILTDERGVPFERPERDDFVDPVDYLRAMYAFKDRVTDHANRAFAEAFRRTKV